VDDEFSPAWRLRKAREREHVLIALVRAQSEWRGVLAIIESAQDAEAAQSGLATALGITGEQAMVMLDAQFRRVTKADRDRAAGELEELRHEIATLEDDQ
jgi:DNA gyrase subunit A